MEFSIPKNWSCYPKIRVHRYFLWFWCSTILLDFQCCFFASSWIHHNFVFLKINLTSSSWLLGRISLNDIEIVFWRHFDCFSFYNPSILFSWRKCVFAKNLSPSCLSLLNIILYLCFCGIRKINYLYHGQMLL